MWGREERGRREDSVMRRKRERNVECEGREQAEVWHWENPSNGLLFVFPGRPGDPGLPWPEGKKEGEGRGKRGPHPPVVTQLGSHRGSHRLQTWSCTHTFAHTLTQHEPHNACEVGWTGVHVSSWGRRRLGEQGLVQISGPAGPQTQKGLPRQPRWTRL